MPVKIGQQFDRPVVALMNESNFQVLQISIQPDNKKEIYGLHCSYIRQSNIAGVPVDAQTAIANTFIQGRVAIVASPLVLDGVTVADLQGFHPFQAPITFGQFNADNVIFDESFVNRLDIDFTEPMEIQSGIPVSIIMSQGYSIGDTGIAVSSVKIGSLNVSGWIVNPLENQININLR